MSASREKKTRTDDITQGPTSREQKRQQEEKEARRSKIIYRTIGALCAVLTVAVIFWHSGLLQRNAAALTINGVKYTAADVQYYFNITRISTLNNYYSYLGMMPFDNNASTKNQIYNSETGATWYDQLLEQTIDSMVSNTALAAQAKAEGYTLSEEAQAELDSALSELETAWVGTGYNSRDAYLRANYGPYITYNRFVELLTQNFLASDYATTTMDGFTYTDADYQSYYQENADTLDTFHLSQFTFQAQVETTDAEGNTIEMTDEEKADALALAQAEAKALAEELQAKLEDGGDPEALAEEYAGQLSGTPALSQMVVGSSLSSYYGDWMKDSARVEGDVTLAEGSTSDTSAYYYVVRFEGRERDDRNTANVRHILVAAETDEGADQPTAAQYQAAREEAEALLAQWQSGEATEDAFAALAQEHSADSGSASNGGLISNISATSGYVETFADWSLDASRTVGDTGIVQNTGSSTKGWHIMYYVGSGDPLWEQTADTTLRNDAYTAWETAATEGYEASQGFGLRFVTG